jgi:hypothetical protein
MFVISLEQWVEHNILTSVFFLLASIFSPHGTMLMAFADVFLWMLSDIRWVGFQASVFGLVSPFHLV